jgi:SAM-dependent methyltransferase
MQNGGYDLGYRSCSCFWGKKPAAFVQLAISLLQEMENRSALDLGCGEGKNAAAIAASGFRVTAIDKSEAAISNAKSAFGSDGIEWLVGDLLAFERPQSSFDLAIATGSFHCLRSPHEVEYAIHKLKDLTKIGGANVLYAFNDGPHDMAGHDENFLPILLPHSFYERAYKDWTVIRSEDTVQEDMHPNNGIAHSHSITRLLARRVR